MAFEIENNLVAALIYSGAAQGFIARFGIASVVRTGAGVYTVTTIESLGDGEDAHSCAVETDEDPSGPSGEAKFINVSKLAPNQWQIRTYFGTTPNGVDFGAQDNTWHFKLFRLATGG